MTTKTAILIDGAFFLRRFPTVYPNKDKDDAVLVAKTMHEMAFQHLQFDKKRSSSDLYRIFFYDCPPLTKKVHYPISKKPLNLSLTDQAKFRKLLHGEIKKKRKTALRLGRLDESNANWILKNNKLQQLIKKEITFADITDDDLQYYARQKVVDMKIGLDIAAISYKKLANQIVLIAGDSDFVPAAKIARREGIDFILDPMWHKIHDELNEHIDGLQNVVKRPKSYTS